MAQSESYQLVRVRDMRGNFLGRKPSTLSEQISDYLHWCEFNRQMTPSTMTSKRQCIFKFVDEHPGLTDLRKLSNKELDAWAASMLEAGKAGKTVNNYVDHVKACLYFLQNQRGEHLTIRLEALLRIKELDNDLPYFTPKEVKLIKAQCQSLRELLLVSLIFESALRINEVIHLQVENLDGCNIRILGKGRKLRDTFILQDTKELLDKWLLLTGISEGYVFPSLMKYGEPLTPQQIRWSINQPIRRAGFKDGSAHALRRSAITAALEGGMQIHDAAKWAGHSDPETTLKHYYKATAEKLAQKHKAAFKSSDK